MYDHKPADSMECNKIGHVQLHSDGDGTVCFVGSIVAFESVNCIRCNGFKHCSAVWMMSFYPECEVLFYYECNGLLGQLFQSSLCIASGVQCI